MQSAFLYCFFAAELWLILQRLILLYKSLRFSDRNSIIGCNFDNTWRFSVKLFDKVARTLPFITFVSAPLNLPNFLINDLDLTTNNEYSGRVASFNTMWQKRYTTLNSVNFAGVKDSKSIPTKSLIDRC